MGSRNIWLADDETLLEILLHCLNCKTYINWGLFQNKDPFPQV